MKEEWNSLGGSQGISLFFHLLLSNLQAEFLELPQILQIHLHHLLFYLFFKNFQCSEVPL